MEQLLTHLPTYGLLLAIGACIWMLCLGAEWAIDGVVHLARRTGLPRIVIGATIISLGTTLPEAFVSVTAAWTDNPGLALGNGVGSIIADTGLVLGLTCILTRVPVNRFILNRTGWIQVGAATFLVVIALGAWGLMSEPKLERWVGVLFLLLLAGYLYITYRWARIGGSVALEGELLNDSELKKILSCLVLIFGGLILVILGARILVPCASEIALRFGVPQDVIAATMVALGTSLPELTTAIASVKRGHPEIMVGNVVGADVLNCLFVIGASAAAKHLPIPASFYTFHFPAMLLILYSFRAFIGMSRNGHFSRWHGLWLLAVYAAYIVSQYVFNLSSLAYH